MLSRKIVYHQDNAPSHRSLQAMAAIYDFGFELLPYAPYSPDLAPSDFHLFPHLKKSLSGIQFRSDEEVIDTVTSSFESLEISFFLEGIKALEHRWKKCIDLKEDYLDYFKRALSIVEAIEAKQRRIEQQRQRRLNSPVRERHNEQQRQYRMNMSENQRALQRENSRLRMQRIRQGDNLPLPTGTCFEEDQIPLHLCGQLDQVCPKCRAKYFELEQTTYSKTFHKCCSKGKVELEPIQTSELLESLMTGKHQLSKNFMENIRSVNSALAFASMGANLAPPPGYGPYCFRINGQIYHRSATMAPKDALRCINNLLKEIMQNEKPLGGKTIVFGGDFRQTLPVVPHGTQAAIVDSGIKFHPLWKKFNILKLDNNIRSIDPEFSAWLLKLGNGELTNDLGLDSDTFEIPSEMVCNGDLVKEIYGDKLLPSDFEQYTDKAILCPRNVDVDDINNRVLDILEGDSITYFSSDSIDDATPEDNESYPPVFLNSLNPSGMPLHKLKL
ncbi:hypothetical protein LAZ67_18001342 [Cordylochernes scorpioides]|uniref:ATP-dependent DNA helicase n=1 Tax=Cordylochernes scorpioides TaxID=51811 RepID=A0ABY6LFM2_9ARAC|nr:hypothetical protein LAZ67_18001342 [Cordylochernes scorpioides]